MHTPSENRSPSMNAVAAGVPGANGAPRQLGLACGLPVKAPRQIQVYDRAKAQALQQAATHERDKQRLESVLAKDADRPLSCYDRDYRHELDKLDQTFPNFSHVTQYLRECHALSRLGDGSIQLEPMLLDGPPGVGKTAYAGALAKLWSTSFVRIDVSSEQTNACLVGLDEVYDTARYGKVLNSLVMDGETANPVIFLDELDKAKTDSHYNIHHALYGLLEPESASSFQDLSLHGLPINAAHVIWIATSNDVRLLSKPLRSRMRVFRISTPTPEQSGQIVRSVYDKLLSSHAWGPAMNPSLFDSVVQCLQPLPAREVRQRLKQACGRAAFDCRNYLVAEDFDPIVVEERPRIGFLH